MRNYAVDSILIRHEAGRGYRLLVVEAVQEGPRQPGVMLRHEDGHREFRPIRTDIPIERALFGYAVLTDDDLTRGFVEMNGARVLVD